MNVAADVNKEEGELAVNNVGLFEDSVERLLYAQPSLNPSKDERGPSLIAGTKLMHLRNVNNKCNTNEYLYWNTA
jgi:hypothetical protein